MDLVVSFFRSITMFISGRVKSNADTKNKYYDIYSKNYLAFRHTSIKNNCQKPSVLTLRFTIKNTTLKKDRTTSFFQIPFFIGMKGFLGKIWLYCEDDNSFMGIYQWKSKEDIDRYLNSTAIKIVKDKCSGNLIQSDIYENLTIDEFITEDENGWQ